MLFLLFLLATGSTWAQTTQGVIAGEVVDATSGDVQRGANVVLTGTALDEEKKTSTDSFGRFLFPSLSPGTYRLEVSLDKYQAQQLDYIELAVAGRLDFTFRLR